ncbi:MULTISPECIES: Trp biosynthesis-associated membrane protein [Actinosynnema]|uniref:Trp biosynthesis-associated membrane protein n=1 Tax=Actinosynnema TaxID=40566 RepID=UPI0020A3B5CA|nr:Trp biosynthesis-associated membrane protein [Actinosynnema pretiosum]MCP2094186.1 Tryptophan-associated transmembrane protein (Trp_oprn_chp) [Actinosynnema pretiosum]
MSEGGDTARDGAGRDGAGRDGAAGADAAGERVTPAGIPTVCPSPDSAILPTSDPTADPADARLVASVADSATASAADPADARPTASVADSATAPATDPADARPAASAADQVADLSGARPVASAADPVADQADVPAADTASSPPPRPGRREQRLVLGLLLLAALVLWGSSALDWGGAEPQWPVPLALLAGAGVAAVLALGGVVRRALGAVLAVVGLLAVVVGVGDLPASGPVVGLLGALTVVGAGVLLLVKGGRMPRMGDRYETPAARKPSADPERELWNALERGDDPTERD